MTRVVLGRNRMEIGMLASCHVARALRCKLETAMRMLRTPVPCTVDALVYFIWYVKHRFRLCSLGNLRCVRVRSGSRVSPLPSGRELKITDTRQRHDAFGSRASISMRWPGHGTSREKPEAPRGRTALPAPRSRERQSATKNHRCPSDVHREGFYFPGK